jgi:hypothetical protein
LCRVKGKEGRISIEDRRLLWPPRTKAATEDRCDIERGRWEWLRWRKKKRGSVYRYVAEVLRSKSSASARNFLPTSLPPALHPRPPHSYTTRTTQKKPSPIMLEAFEILTTSGVVLWSKSYAPVGAHVVNSLINDVFIEERVQLQATTNTSPIYKKEKYTLKWKRVKEFNLIFVVCEGRLDLSLHY